MSRSELIFCGRNRRVELRRLKRAFDDVSAAAQGSSANQWSKKPSHKVVLIEAERGLGKTRLVMELYRHITATCDPNDYWPDGYSKKAEDFEVMPPAETCKIATDPPFIWWGMGIPDGPNPGNTAFATLEDLLPHLVSAKIARRRARSGKEFLTDAADLAIDIGLEVGTEISGIGLLKRLGQSSFKIGSIVKRHYGAEVDPLASADEQIVSVIDAVVADLTRLFNPRSAQFAGIPLVIFVDDAQFADHDDTMSALVERLLSRAARENWPVLFLLTHWSRQLGRWKDADGITHPSSHIGQILDHARKGLPDKQGAFAGEGGKSLPEANFIRINLNVEVDDLTPAIRARFPGLEEDDVSAIADKSRGNPRKLEQVLMRMERKPRWFQGNNLANSLDDVGRAAVMALADLPIEQVVLERFTDTPEDVRRSALIASLIGHRFVVGLVERLARNRFDHEVRSNLEIGEVTYRFLKDVVDQSRNDIASFTERLFLDAACEYRESGLAHFSLHDWPKDAEMMADLDDLLMDLVSRPERFEGLNKDDLASALSLAGARMEKVGAPEAGLALARLVFAENLRGNSEGSYSAAARFMTWSRLSPTELRQKFEEVPVHIMHNVADTLMRMGRSKDAQSIYEVLRVIYAERTARHPMNIQAQHGLFSIHESLGDLFAARGEVETAMHLYRVSIGITSRLAKTGVYLAMRPIDIAVIQTKLGDLHAERGEVDAAKRSYLESLAFSEQMIKEHPDLTHWRYGLSISQNKLGDLHVGRSQFDMALERYRAAFDIAENLSEKSTTDSRLQIHLSVCHEKFADLHMIHGEFELAMKRFRVSLDIVERLTKTDPVNTLWQRRLSVCYERIGDLNMARGETKAALEQYLASLDLRERLAATDPTNVSWQRDVFTVLVKLADGGDNPVGRFSRALAIFTRLEMERKLPSADGWTNIKILKSLLRAQRQERKNR